MARRKSPATPRPAISSFPHALVVPVASHRKFPDPVHLGIQHHTGYVPAVAYPADGFPNDPNIRPQNIDRQIYRAIAESLLNKDCIANTFHLKSKGEIHIAAQVRELGKEAADSWFEEHLRPLFADDTQFADTKKKYTLLEVIYERGNGIADGGHTDRIWSEVENQEAVRRTYEENGDGEQAEEPNRNHLSIEWITGVPTEWVPEIVGGRNTGLQVQEKTLANHQRKFDWLKKLISKQCYAGKIAYRENEDRKSKPVDIRELIALLAPFNRAIYSLEEDAGKRVPVSAFSQKAAVLKVYVADQAEKDEDVSEDADSKSLKGLKSYQRLRKIAHDILVLHDLIHQEAVDLYNRTRKGKGGKFSFVDHLPDDQWRKGKRHYFVYADEKGRDKLMDGALYPMLAAFSAAVTADESGDFVWATPDGFEGVKNLWRELAPQFMDATQNVSLQVGRNPAQIGKSTNHWLLLYMLTKMKLTALNS